MTQVPEYLYKFVSDIGAAEAMLGGSMKFTKIDDLNDPAELVAWFDGDIVEQSLNELREREITDDDLVDIQRQERLIRKFSLKTMVFKAPRTTEEYQIQIGRAVYDSQDTMRRYLAATADNIRSRVGVLSLSERWDSFPMWAHYAANAEGFCIILNDLAMAFPGDDTGVLNEPLPVIYATPRPVVTFDTRTDRNLFLSKLEDWAYEKEWRVAHALSSCSKNDRGHHIRRIDPKHIVGTICGWKTPTPTIKRLMTQVKKASPHAQIWQAAVDGSGRMTKARIA